MVAGFLLKTGMKTIKFNGQECTIKCNFRAMMACEKLTGEAFALKKTTDFINFGYCVLQVNNPAFSLSYDEFIDYCDDHQDEFIAVINAVTEDMTGTSKTGAGDSVAKKK